LARVSVPSTQLAGQKAAQTQTLMLTHGERNLLVEHILVHAHFVAVRLAGGRTRIAHAFQHHLQEQRVDLLRHCVQRLR
jgi:hypothetical protein